MALSDYDKLVLKRHGFIDFEINAFDKAVTPAGQPQLTDIRTVAWSNMLMSRHRWIEHMRTELEWSEARIALTITRFYSMKTERTPYEFLKREYRPPTRITDYQAARQARAKRETDNLYRRRR